MNHSETITKLAVALCKAQSEMPSAPKDKVNPHFKSNYTDLTTLWDTCRPVLAANGLSVIQTFSGDSGLAVDTTVLHVSGEWISGTLRMPVEKATAQSVGSAITYARRYGLASILGVVSDEDDDGNEASKPEAKPTTPRRETPKPANGKQPSPGEIVGSQIKSAIEAWIPHDPEDYATIRDRIKRARGYPDKPSTADAQGLLAWIESNIENHITYIDAIKETKQ